jgi:hypothetical protein
MGMYMAFSSLAQLENKSGDLSGRPKEESYLCLLVYDATDTWNECMNT